MLSQRLQEELEDLVPVFQPPSQPFKDQTSIFQIETVPQHSAMSLPNYSTIPQSPYSKIPQPNNSTILQPPYSTTNQPHHITKLQPQHSMIHNTVPQSQHNIPQTENRYIPQDSPVLAKTVEDELLYPTVIYDND